MIIESESLGLKVKSLRVEKKISAEVLRAELGYSSRQSIYDIEKGRITKLSVAQYKKLGLLLGVDYKYFWDEEIKNEIQEPGSLYKPQITKKEFTSKASRMASILEENNRLWRENAMLKTLIIEHGIEVKF